MKKEKYNTAPRELLIATSMDFSAFLISRKGVRINKIILFGSVARGEQDAESDVDLFIDTEEQNEKEIRKVLDMWEISKRAEEWRVLGATNPIALHIGRLEKWEAIRRAALSDGIFLYGKYIEQKRGELQYTLVTVQLKEMPKTSKIAIWRKLYGYSQRLKGKVYKTKGLVEELGGTRIGAGSIMVPIEGTQRLLDFLRKKRARFAARSVWGE